MTYLKQKGFGLIEVLISLLVISVGVAGIIGLQNYMRKTSAEAEEYLISARLAQQSLDDARGFTDGNFSTIVSGGLLNYLSSASSHTVNGVTFTRTVNATDVAVDAAGGLGDKTQLKQLKVEFKWSSLDGVSRAQSLEMPISPVSLFEADSYYAIGKTGAGVGGGVGGGGGSANPPLDLDPSKAAHMPPAYVADYEYSNEDQVTIAGIKYSCFNAAWCSDDATYGPGKTFFSAAWSICRNSDLTPAKCRKCMDAGNAYAVSCPVCTTAGGDEYTCPPPTPEPSGEPSGEPNVEPGA